jgi:protein-disulfide isomerase/uncharacterized membrane protein
MNPLLLWLTRLLALAACGLSIYLWQASVAASGVAGCDWEAFDCNAALGSRWAKWFGIPVAAGGTVCYLAAVIGSFLVGRKGTAGTAGWWLLEFALPAAIGAGIWFTLLQATTLGSFCLYCLLTHACGLVLGGLVFALRRSSTEQGAGAPLAIGLGQPNNAANESTSAPPLGLPTAAGFLALVVLIGGQFFGPKPIPAEPVAAKLSEEFRFDEDEVVPTAAEADPTSNDEEAKPSNEVEKPSYKAPDRRIGGSRQVKLLGGSLTIDTYEHPILGSPEAEHIVVELMDYACPHCRELHEKIQEALKQYEGKVAVVVMPVPGEITCNPYARKARKESLGACHAAKVAVAVADLAPDEFEKFHHWLLKDDKIPNRTAIIIEAKRHADSAELSLALRDAEGEYAGRIKQYISLSAKLRKQGVRGVPAQILGDKVHSAKIESIDEVIDLWSKAFEIERPAVELPF